MYEFQINKKNFVEQRLFESGRAEQRPAIGDGEILLKIDRFAVTANNITYAVAGDTMGYWKFFPASGEDADGWGMMPVWGFADVIESNADGVPVGDRLFGYLPPATHLRMTPVAVTERRMIDAAAHRRELPSPYNSYSRVKAEPGYDSAMDNERMLLWPLHITSFCIWDALQEEHWYGAQQIIILSASSKTSIGLAYALDDDSTAPESIAITSARNLDLVRKLGLYDQSITYETLSKIDATVPSVIVDMSGNGSVLGQLHTQLGDNMMRCINIGLTHWGAMEKGAGIISERSHFFFAPAQIQKRVKDWGADKFAERSSSFMSGTALKSRDWLEMRKIDGLTGLAGIYSDLCDGKIAANEGLIVEL